MTYARGEEIEVIIARDGLADDSGIAYLPDETMVVVVGGAGRAGQSVHARIVGLERTPVGASLVANVES